ncbi:MAG TPA: hypothetical protein VGQ62_20820 [Chloroflexota bacterium]|jgi:hypothetical protein|nr:hypothetical protein [Chloroflexota bacterium]
MDSLDSQLLVTAAFVVAFVFGKHLQAGYEQLRVRVRLAEQPIRRRRP